MLMKVVLPAPLVPIKPTTESLSMAALMSLAAVTAPKFLFRPCASRIAAISSHLAPAEQRPQAVRQEHDNHQQRAAEHRSEEHTSELQSRLHLVCRLLLEKK